MGSGDVKDTVEITHRTMGSQSFNWQVREGLIKKTESEGFTQMHEKNSEGVFLLGVTKGQFQLGKNERCHEEVRHDGTERCPLNLAARIIDPGMNNLSEQAGGGSQGMCFYFLTSHSSPSRNYALKAKKVRPWQT